MALDAHDFARLSPDAQKQVLAQLTAPKKPNKYRNRKTEVNGITFDSKREADRYLQLFWQLQRGEIRNLRLQAEFTLQEAFRDEMGRKVEAIRYRADFAYERETAPDCYGTTHWVRVVEDVKSEATRKDKVYQIKRKMLKDKFNIDIEEV